MLRQKSANYIVCFKRISYMLKIFGNFNKINTGITWEKSAPAQQQCQKFDVYLLENYFTYVC
jgi:hypothetical protein